MRPQPHKSPRIRRLSSARRAFSALGTQEKLGGPATLGHRRACLQEGSGGGGFTTPGLHSTPGCSRPGPVASPPVSPRLCLASGLGSGAQDSPSLPLYVGLEQPALQPGRALQRSGSLTSDELWPVWGPSHRRPLGQESWWLRRPMSSAPGHHPPSAQWSQASVYPSGTSAVVRLPGI